MSDTILKNKSQIKKRLYAVLLIVYDIVCVNLAYLLAILLRFYVNFKFHESGASYLISSLQFAPYYTVLSIGIFAAFRLYSGIWRYAGLHDINRIIFANLATCIVHVAGTLLFVRRMPITYYVLGAGIQFLLVAFGRLFYRFMRAEVLAFGKSKTEPKSNIMIVGMGESARTLIRLIQENRESLMRPVCIVDFRGHAKGFLYDGLPVIGSIDEIPNAVQKYLVQDVVIADSLMPTDTRLEIKRICKELSLEVQDFSGYSQVFCSRLGLKSILEYTAGSVVIKKEEQQLFFENGEQALMQLSGPYTVKSIYTKENQLFIEVDASIEQNDTDWIQEHEKETGEEVSFF